MSRALRRTAIQRAGWRHAVVLACLFAACAGTAKGPFGREFVPPDLAGAELGMTVTQLKHARPNLLQDGAQVWERLPNGSAGYLMADGGFARAFASIFCDCTVRGISLALDVPVEDSSTHRQEIEKLTRMWRGLPGLRSEEEIAGQYDGVPAVATVLRFDAVTVVLVAGVNSPVRTPRGLLLRVFVLDSRMSLQYRIPT